MTYFFSHVTIKSAEINRLFNQPNSPHFRCPQRKPTPGPGERTALLTTPRHGRAHPRRPRGPYLGSGGGRRPNSGRGLRPLRDRFTSLPAPHVFLLPTPSHSLLFRSRLGTPFSLSRFAPPPPPAWRLAPAARSRPRSAPPRAVPAWRPAGAARAGECSRRLLDATPEQIGRAHV